jgi:hypothetical protein
VTAVGFGEIHRDPEFPEIASQEVLGIECTTTLEEALEEVIPWIKDQALPKLREFSL